MNDAFATHQQTQKQLDTQKNQMDSLRDYARIARLRYDNGYADYLARLDADRSLFNLELGYTQTKASLHLALIGLYRAMGGGWVAKTETLADQGQGQHRITSTAVRAGHGE